MARGDRDQGSDPEELASWGEALVVIACESPEVEGALGRIGISVDEIEAQVLDRILKVEALLDAVREVRLTKEVADDAAKGLWLSLFYLWWTRRPLRRSLYAILGLGALGAAIGLRSPLGTQIGLVLGATVGLVIFGGMVLQQPRLRKSREQSVRARKQAVAAFSEVRDRTVENAILPEIRQLINELEKPAFDRTLPALNTSGLRNLFDPKYEVPVKATESLRGTLESLEAGSVGIAGPRGVGKSTIIAAACDGRLEEKEGFEGRGMVVSAPVRYAGQEFMRFLFARLCMKTLELDEREKRLVSAREMNRNSYRNWLLRVAFGCAAIALAIGAFDLLEGRWDPFILTPLGGVAIFGSMAAVIHAWPELSGFSPAHPIRDLAQEYLERLRFLETFSEERSSELSAKSAKLGSRRAVSRASIGWTLPEVIHHYRDLAGQLAEFGPLLIGIDELDKMATSEEARGFLNELKSLFDQPGVFYLVSISEDALSDFERRGQPIRDVFDSVFSEVLHLGYLGLDESSSLLKRRAIGIPPPWPALFHALAGGLPREALRVARSASRIAEQSSDLSEVTLALVADRVAAHEHAVAVVASRDVGVNGLQPVLSWLRSLPPVERGQELKAAVSGLHRRLEVEEPLSAFPDSGMPREAAERLKRQVIELAAGSYHSLTCLEFFSALTPARYESACEEEGAEPIIELLARAHQDLAVAPKLAWETLDRFRNQSGLHLVDYPV